MTDKSMSISFVNHFVAFIDVLGFAEMVKHDTEAGDGDLLFVERLYEVHAAIIDLVGKSGLSIKLTQFSDSIVLSVPISLSSLLPFLEVVAELQILLFEKGLLCRGGIAYGKHYSEASFMFSDAMISAYRLESESAKYPRILISQDIIDLYHPGEVGMAHMLVFEDDGAVFVDYFRYAARNSRDLSGRVSELAESIRSVPSSSVREKIRWVLQYWDHAMSTAVAKPRFSKLSTA